MLRSTSEKKKPSASAHRDREGGNKSKRQESSSAEERPGMAERTSSGLKAAQHLTKAAHGGTLRKGFSLWRATSHLKVAAAGAGDLIKRHPAPAALIGGAVTGAAIFFAARSMAAGEEQGSDEESEGEEESEQDEESGEEEVDDEESEEDEEE